METGKQQHEDLTPKIREVKIGFYNKDYKMSKVEKHKVKQCNIKGFFADFEIKLGPLLWGGEELSGTYVLEIHYEESEKSHSGRLSLGGFGNNLHTDYAKRAHEVAKEFMKKDRLVLSRHINSWPIFQAVVVEDPKLKNE